MRKTLNHMSAKDTQRPFPRLFLVLLVLLILKFILIYITQILQKDVNVFALILFLISTSTAIVLIKKQSKLLFISFAGILLTYMLVNYSRSSHYSLLVLVFFVYLFDFFLHFSSRDFLRFLNYTLALVYLFGFLNKLNIGFLSGFVFYQYSIFHESIISIGFNSIVSILLSLISITVVVFEGFMAFSLFKNKLNVISLSLANYFHLSIIFVMHEYSLVTLLELVIFNVTCIILLTLAFAGDLRPGICVIWDANCTFCKSTIQIIRKLDFLGILEFIPNSQNKKLELLGITKQQSDLAMQVVEVSTGFVYSGFFGFRRILLALIPFSLLFPFMNIPLVERIGAECYRRIALRRSCKI
jgi:predicted DCC family thiol-disulfide oxidoreductase YuxK